MPTYSRIRLTHVRVKRRIQFCPHAPKAEPSEDGNHETPEHTYSNEHEAPPISHAKARHHKKSGRVLRIAGAHSGDFDRSSEYSFHDEVDRRLAVEDGNGMWSLPPNGDQFRGLSATEAQKRAIRR
jgi:hypothetical protein